MQNNFLDGLTPSLRDIVNELDRSSGIQQMREVATSVDLANKFSGASDLRFATQHLDDVTCNPHLANASSSAQELDLAKQYLRDVAVNQQLGQVVSEMRSQWDTTSIVQKEFDRLQHATRSFGPAIDTMEAAMTYCNADEIVRNVTELTVAERFQDTLGRLGIQNDLIRSYADALPAYADFLTRYEPMIMGHAGIADYARSLETDFAIVMAGATAWSSLKPAVDELMASIGPTAGIDAARAYFDDCQLMYKNAAWGQLVESVTSAMQYSRFDIDDDDNEVGTDISESDGVDEVTTRETSEEVADVTLIFGMSLFEVQYRLIAVAQRIDPLLDASTPLNQLILCVASGHPEHAAAITGLAYPFLVRMNWPLAAAGACADGTAERLTREDAEEFGALARDLVKVVDAIECSE